VLFVRCLSGAGAHFPVLSQPPQPFCERKHLGILCGIAILAVLIATLSPFNFFLPNRVSWLPEEHGIRFGRGGVVVSKGVLRSTATGDACSVELLLRPSGINFYGTLLSFYDPNNPKRVLVQQWGDDLLVSHEFRDAENKLRRSKFDVNQFFQQGKLVLLTITSAPHKTVVYRNGLPIRSFDRFTIEEVDLSGQIVMGTSAVDYGPWQGDIYGLAIYSRELAQAEVFENYSSWIGEHGIIAKPDGATALYTFTEGTGPDIRNIVISGADLRIPNHFGVPHKPFLSSPVADFKASWDYVLHVLENVAGFVPLGLVFCVYLSRFASRRWAIVYAIIAAATLSFTIEVLQAYIPQRDSDITDIISNTLGSGVGALLAKPNIPARILALVEKLT
jgi:VanZ family protein